MSKKKVTRKASKKKIAKKAKRKLTTKKTATIKKPASSAATTNPKSNAATKPKSNDRLLKEIVYKLDLIANMHTQLAKALDTIADFMSSKQFTFNNDTKPESGATPENAIAEPSEGMSLFDDASPAPISTPEITKEQLTQKLQEVGTKCGMNKVRELITNVGAERISDIDPAKYGTITDACKKLLQ